MKGRKIKYDRPFIESEYLRYLKGIERQMGSGETHSDQLNRKGKALFGAQFRGVFPADRIPVLPFPSMCIINLDTSTQPGSHWVACVKTSRRKAIYYDSFGRNINRILPNAKKSGNGLVKSTDRDREQKVKEANCGQRCLASLKVFQKYGERGFQLI